MPSRVIPSKALTEGFYRIIDNSPELVEFYDAAGYSGRMSGEGNWTVLYADEAPVGLLWLSMETEGCDVELLPGSITDLLAIEQLRVRQYASIGFDAGQTYAAIAERYSSSDEDTGDLSAVRQLIVPDEDEFGLAEPTAG